MDHSQLSLLSGEEIKSNNLVIDSEEKLFRASTYDLSVGDIFVADGVCDGSKYSLPPGGMVRVVSTESLNLPDTITGHVLLKNELCARGVLAINIGVVDPKWEGPISSTLINFGRANFEVEKGTPFLRVSFHRCLKSSMAKAVKFERESYIKRVKQEVLAYSGPTFLSMDKTAAQAAETAFGKFKNALIIWASLAAIVLALLAIFAPLGAANMDKYVAAREQRELKLEQAVEEKIEDRYETRIKYLSDQIDQLKKNSVEKPTQGNTSARKP